MRIGIGNSGYSNPRTTLVAAFHPSNLFLDAVVVVPHIRLPFIENFPQCLSLPGFDGSFGNRIDEDIGYAIIKYSIRNTILLEDEQWEMQTEKNSSFQMVPCRRKHGLTSYGFLFYRASF